VKDSAVSKDGTQIVYEVEGSGEPTIVFVHGWSCGREDWARQVAHFSKSHRVVAIDLGGHGESGKDRKEYLHDGFGDDVVAVADKLGLQRMVLVGHSMGGGVIVNAATKLGGRVIGLVGADTFGNVGNPPSAEFIESRLVPLRADFAGRVTSLANDWFIDRSEPAEVSRIVARAGATRPDIGIGATTGSQHYWQKQGQDELRGLKQKVVTINAERTKENTLKNFAVAKTGGIEIEPIFMPGVGHFVMLDGTDEFNRLLTETIRGFEAGVAAK
jgi:pimeloyl-ACP methyl ester carboxylesterase